MRASDGGSAFPFGVSRLFPPELERLEQRFLARGEPPFRPGVPAFRFSQSKGGRGCLLVLAVLVSVVFLVGVVRSLVALIGGAAIPDALPAAPVFVAMLALYVVLIADRYRTVDLVVEADRLHRRDGVGPFSRYRTFPLDEIANVRCEFGDNADESAVANGGTVFLVLRTGEEIPLLYGRRNPEQALWAADLLRDAYFSDRPAVVGKTIARAAASGETVIVDEAAADLLAAPRTDRDALRGYDYPPSSFGAYRVYLENTEEFATVMNRLPPSLAEPAGPAFVVRQIGRPWFLICFALLWAAGAGYATWLNPDSPIWDLRRLLQSGMALKSIGDIIFAVASAAALVFAVVGLVMQRWFVFLPDKLVTYTRCVVFGRHTVFPKSAIRDARIGSNSKGNQNVHLLMANEEESILVDFGGAGNLSWFRTLVQEWLKRPSASAALRVETPAPAASTSARARLDLLDNPPDGIKALRGEAARKLELAMIAHGQPAFHPGAKAVTYGMHPLAAVLIGGFLTFWLCGWYGAVLRQLWQILQGTASPTSLVFVVIFGVVGLLPLRVFGSVLFSRVDLVLEPGRVRVRRRGLLFRRYAMFAREELRGYEVTDRAMGILNVLSLHPTVGAPVTIHEEAEKSARMRWFARVLGEVAGLREVGPSSFMPDESAIDFGYGDLPKDGDRRSPRD